MIDWLIFALSTPWVGALVSIVSLGLAVFFYFRSKKRPRLSYQVSEFSVVGELNSKFPKELEILFDGKEVPRVTMSKVVVWNSGNSTLDGQQIVSSDPLRMEVVGGEILSASIKKVTREVNSVSLAPENFGKGPVSINFDYLDQKDGFSLEVIHSGARGGLLFLGTLKELPQGFARVSAFDPADLAAIIADLPFLRSRVTFLFFILIAGVLMFFGGLLAKQTTTVAHYVNNSVVIQGGPNVSFMLLGGLYASLPLAVFWLSRRKYPASLHDDEVEIEDNPKMRDFTLDLLKSSLNFEELSTRHIKRSHKDN